MVCGGSSTAEVLPLEVEVEVALTRTSSLGVLATMGLGWIVSLCSEASSTC